MAKIKLQSYDDILKPFPPIEFVIEDLLAEGTVNMMFGESGDGKTLTMQWASVCVASGEPFLGKEVKPGAVLYIDEESNEILFKTRMRKVLAGIGNTEIIPFFYTSLNGLDFTDRNDRQELERFITDGKFVLVIVDALMDIMPGKDENAVKDVLPAFQFARHVANKTNCSFVFLHHTNRNGGYRGSSAIKGALDNMISIKKEGNFITLNLEKHRDSEEKELTGEMIFQDDSFELRVGRQQSFGKVEELVLRHLSKASDSSISDIEKGQFNQGNETKSGSIRSAANSLVKKAFVYRTDNNGAGVTALYALTQSGIRAAVKKGWIDDPFLAADYAS